MRSKTESSSKLECSSEEELALAEELMKCPYEVCTECSGRFLHDEICTSCSGAGSIIRNGYKRAALHFNQEQKLGLCILHIASKIRYAKRWLIAAKAAEKAKGIETMTVTDHERRRGS